jgi:hypothetical protein
VTETFKEEVDPIWVLENEALATPPTRTARPGLFPVSEIVFVPATAEAFK